MINNFVFYFLEQILNKPCEIDELKQKWIGSIHKGIGHKYDNGLEDIFVNIVESSPKFGLTENDKHKDKFLISITTKGIQAYSTYLNEIAIPNENLKISLESLKNERNSAEIAKKANELSKEANELSKEANKKSGRANWISFAAVLFTIASFILSILAFLK